MRFLVGVVILLVITFCFAVVFSPAFAREIKVKVDCNQYAQIQYDLVKHANEGRSFESFSGWPDDNVPVEFRMLMWLAANDGFTPERVRDTFLAICMAPPVGDMSFELPENRA